MQLNDRWLVVGQSWVPCLTTTDIMSGCSNDPLKRQGRVYVYEHQNNEWKLHSVLTSPLPGDSSGFGSALSLQGDRIVVSDSLNRICWNSNQDSASTHEICKATTSIFMFEYDGTTWQAGTKLPTPELAHSQGFGYGVALSGQHLAISVPAANWCEAHKPTSQPTDSCKSPSDPAMHESGAVYLYRNEGSGWIHQTTLKSKHAVKERNFGRVIDLDNNRLLVGSNHRKGPCLLRDESVNNLHWNPKDLECGISPVELFRFDGNRWSPEAVLFQAETPRSPGSSFGKALALHGNRALVGAYQSQHCPQGAFDDPTDWPDCVERGTASIYFFPE